MLSTNHYKKKIIYFTNKIDNFLYNCAVSLKLYIDKNTISLYKFHLKKFRKK